MLRQTELSPIAGKHTCSSFHSSHINPGPPFLCMLYTASCYMSLPRIQLGFVFTHVCIQRPLGQRDSGVACHKSDKYHYKCRIGSMQLATFSGLLLKVNEIDQFDMFKLRGRDNANNVIQLQQQQCAHQLIKTPYKHTSIYIYCVNISPAMRSG